MQLFNNLTGQYVNFAKILFLQEGYSFVRALDELIEEFAKENFEQKLPSINKGLHKKYFYKYCTKISTWNYFNAKFGDFILGKNSKLFKSPSPNFPSPTWGRLAAFCGRNGLVLLVVKLLWHCLCHFIRHKISYKMTSKASTNVEYSLSIELWPKNDQKFNFN